VSINSFAARLFAACLGLLAGGLAWPPAAEAATTTYTSAWGGGTIATGNEALINNGASITGNVVANGQLTFNQTTNLAVGTLISGSGTVFLTNTGTVSLTGSTSYSAGTTVSRGTLVVTGSSGRVSQPFATMVLGTNSGDNGGLVITAGGSVSTGAAQVGYGAGSRGVATVGTGGSWNTPVGLVVGASGTGLKNGVLLGGTGSLVNNGTLVFNRGLNYTYSGTISGSGAITKRVTGMLTLAGASSVSGPTTIEKGNVQLAHARALSASTITPLAGGTMSLTAGLQATVGGLVPNAGGLVDVGSGMVTVASGLSAATMVAALEAGRGPVGRWTGTTGITSGSAAASLGERTVGWLDNGNGSVAFAFAAEGDTNLDWQLDIIDAANFLAASKFDSGTPASWNQGDFTYDGIVDILDAAGFVATGLFDAGPYNQPAASADLVAVPEPAGCGLAAIAAGVAILVRRRR
jgi:autotransporter-associated beta strand protein